MEEDKYIKKHRYNNIKQLYIVIKYISVIDSNNMFCNMLCFINRFNNI
jgi:hypothetical protein